MYGYVFIAPALAQEFRCLFSSVEGEKVEEVTDYIFTLVQFNSVAQSCSTLCDPMNCTTPGLPVHHQLRET